MWEYLCLETINRRRALCMLTNQLRRWHEPSVPIEREDYAIAQNEAKNGNDAKRKVLVDDVFIIRNFDIFHILFRLKIKSK